MTDLKSDIKSEIERVKVEIDEQKKLVRSNVKKNLVVETAEVEMKALHTRLSVLEGNLAKLG